MVKSKSLTGKEEVTYDRNEYDEKEYEFGTDV